MPITKQIRILSKIAALLLVIGANHQAAIADWEDDRQEYMRLNKQFLPTIEAGRYAQAEQNSLRMWDLARRTFPNDFGLWGAPLMYLGMVYEKQGRYDEAETVTLRSIFYWQQAYGPEHAVNAELFSNLGVCYWHQSRYAEAEQNYQRALKILKRHLNHPDARSPKAETLEGNLGRLFNNMAIVYFEQGRFEHAIDHYQQALRTYERAAQPNEFEIATSLANLANAYREIEEYQKAEDCCSRALKIRERILDPEHPFIARSWNDLATIYQVQEKYAEAEALYRKALAHKENSFGGNHADVASALLNLSNLEREQKKYADAERTIERAIGILDKASNQPRLEFGCYNSRAQTRWLSGRREDAIADMQRAIQCQETIRRNVAGAESGRAYYFEGLSWAFERTAQWQLELGRLDQAFETVDRFRARTLVDQMNVQGVDLIDTLAPHDAARLRQRENRANSELASLEKQLDNLKSQPDLKEEQRKVVVEQLEEQISRWQQEQVNIYKDTRNASSAYRLIVGKDFQPIGLDQLQNWVAGQDALFLQYYLGDDNASLFVIDGDKPRAVKLELDDATAKELGTDAGPLTADRVKAAMTLNGQDLPQRLAAGQSDRAVVDRLAALWKALIPEGERDGLISGKYKRLIVIPDGSIVNLPFDSLVVEPRDDPVYLLDRGPPIIAGPSATLLYNLAHRGDKGIAKSGKQPVLTVGNPIYRPLREAPRNTNPNSGSATELMASLQPSARFASRTHLKALPHSNNEVGWVAEIFGKMGYLSDKLTQAQATEANLRAAVAGREIIHLACHGLVDNDYENFFGALALSPGPQGAADPANDGFLTLPEIYELNLKDCELAILSACQTNYGPEQRGEGVWALSRGFLVAGSRRVIASNWLVDDASAASLVSVFCSLLAKQHAAGDPLDYAAALHDAKRWVRKQDKWKDPYYWGTFVLIGPN